MDIFRGENWLDELKSAGGDIPSPAEFFGDQYASTPMRHDQIVSYCEALADGSSCALLREYGRTHEARPLIHLVISSEENLKNLDHIQAERRKLSNGAEIDTDIPLVAIFGSNLHGDECSGSDAALALAYSLLISDTAESRSILKNVILVVDPVENPDGRERILALQAIYKSQVSNYNQETLANCGVWPGGRGNHYFIDLNRDVLAQTQPETKARTKAMTYWMPQVVVDVHEMEVDDTYLFACPAEPLNPHIPEHIHKWWDTFAEELGAGFDQLGQGYYRGEWNEVFFPGYADIWPVYHGALTLLFEQSTTCGGDVMKSNGRIVTYTEAVRNQLCGFWSVVQTAQDNRQELYKDWAEYRCSSRKEGAGQAFYLLRDDNDEQLNALAEVLLNQGIEVHKATAQISEEILEGSLIVCLEQGSGRLIRNLLDIDVPMPADFLEADRKQLLEGGESQLYDISAWSLPLFYNVKAIKTAVQSPNNWQQLAAVPQKLFTYVEEKPKYGFLYIDPELRLTAALLQTGIQVRVGSDEFMHGDRQYGAGTFLVRLEDNESIDTEVFHRIAAQQNVEIIAVDRALSQKNVDLGGQTFSLLTMPRAAILGGEGLSSTAFGSCWHLLDAHVGMRLSHINTGRLFPVNLRRYNVIILPPRETFGLLGHETVELVDYRDILGAHGIKALKEWVAAGGTLVTMADSAAFFAEEYGWTDECSENICATRFMPKGAFLNVKAVGRHWLNYGMTREFSALFNTQAILNFDAEHKGDTALVFDEKGGLVSSGLVWPEAVDTIANSVYLTRHQEGLGQVISFAADPTFRRYTSASSRLFSNAVILGAGLGCQQSWPNTR